MSRYFFHIVTGDYVPDEEGIKLPDLTAARHAAVDILAEQIKSSGEMFWKAKSWRLEIADTTGSGLAAITVLADLKRNSPL